MSTRHAFIIARCIAAGLAFWAVSKHPHGFYVLMRWVVCLTCIWGIVLSYRRPWPSLAPVYGLLAIVYNPLLPFHFGRLTWHNIYIAAGFVLLATLAFQHDTGSKN